MIWRVFPTMTIWFWFAYNTVSTWTCVNSISSTAGFWTEGSKGMFPSLILTKKTAIIRPNSAKLWVIPGPHTTESHYSDPHPEKLSSREPACRVTGGHSPGHGAPSQGSLPRSSLQPLQDRSCQTRLGAHSHSYFAIMLRWKTKHCYYHNQR